MGCEAPLNAVSAAARRRRHVIGRRQALDKLVRQRDNEGAVPLSGGAAGPGRCVCRRQQEQSQEQEQQHRFSGGRRPRLLSRSPRRKWAVPHRRRCPEANQEMARSGPGRLSRHACRQAGIYRRGPTPASATRRLGRADLCPVASFHPSRSARLRQPPNRRPTSSIMALTWRYWPGLSRFNS